MINTLLCGLGCRDSLRVEGRIKSLYGNEINEDITPIQKLDLVMGY